MLSTRERGSAQQPCIAACANVFWWPFWPTCANCHSLANRALRAISMDAWQLAWVGRKCRQNRLVMVRLLCHGESSSSMFCGCGVAIVQYTSCKVQCPNNTPTVWNFPPIYLGDKMAPRAWWAQRNNLLTAEVIPQGWTVGERWKQGFIFLWEISGFWGTLVHTTLLDNLSSF